MRFILLHGKLANWSPSYLCVCCQPAPLMQSDRDVIVALQAAGESFKEKLRLVGRALPRKQQQQQQQLQDPVTMADFFGFNEPNL